MIAVLRHREMSDTLTRSLALEPNANSFIVKATALLKGHLQILKDRERQVTGTPFPRWNDWVRPLAV